MSKNVQHVMPSWEYHEPSPDCFCEPRCTIGESGVLWDHDAKVCITGRAHEFFAMPPSHLPDTTHGQCIVCGATQPRFVMPSGVDWPL